MKEASRALRWPERLRLMKQRLRSIHIRRLFRKAVVSMAMLPGWQVFDLLLPGECGRGRAILEAC
jgi:hypothetical protein